MGIQLYVSFACNHGELARRRVQSPMVDRIFALGSLSRADGSTHADQLLVSLGPAPSLESLLDKVQQEAAAPSAKHRASWCFELIQPIMFQATRMSREFFENVSGDFARRQPISELAVRKVLDELTTMQALITYCFSGVDFPEETSLREPPEYDASRPEISTAIRGCAFGMSIMFTNFVITVHNELAIRAQETIRDLPSPVPSQYAPWTSSRQALLRTQAHALALSALSDLLRVFKLQVYPRHGRTAQLSQALRWAEFCADEADCNGGIAGISGADVNLLELFERVELSVL
ncbi:Beta-lactamase/transpeptidase-like protein [Mycena chlorophos]|uniref:Beta-lactamase/transpeptidase-like protein n=1 Tax=Mycena chlorophos TaxID=658473 RepID=A0A8H6TJI1_MYCCL|nr:Beta-lactamase/transpeptidase-like protein [Mycena chlorophos]